MRLLKNLNRGQVGYLFLGLILGSTVFVVAETTVMDVTGDLRVSDRVASGRDLDSQADVAVDGEGDEVGIRGTALGDAGSETDNSYGLAGVAEDAQGIGAQGEGGLAGLGGLGDTHGVWAEGGEYGGVLQISRLSCGATSKLVDARFSSSLSHVPLVEGCLCAS